MTHWPQAWTHDPATTPAGMTRRAVLRGGIGVTLAAIAASARAAGLPAAADIARLAADAQATAAKARALATRFTQRRDVREFGVTGHGADELALLQKAVDATAGQAVLVIPAGMTVATGGTLNLPANSHVHIDGTIKLLPLQVTSMVYVLQINGSNAAVTGAGILDGNRAAQQNTGKCAGIGTPVVPRIIAAYVQGVTVQNCKYWPVNLVGCADCVVEETTLRNSGNSCEFSHAINCHFLNNTVEYIADDGLGLYGNCTSCTVMGNLVHDCATGPFVLADSAQKGPCSNNIVANNIVFDAKNSGVFVSSFDPINNTHSNIVLIGNISYHTRANTLKNVTDFEINGVRGCLIENNVGIGPSSQVICYGMVLQNTLSDVIVRGNYLSNASTSGECLLNNAQSPRNANVVIDGNFLVGRRAGFGVRLSVQNSSYLNVRNNIITGSFAGHPYWDDGRAATFTALRPEDTGERFAPPPSIPSVSPGIVVQRTALRSVTLPAGLACWILNTASAVPSLAVTLPATPAPGRVLTLIFEQSVAALTIAPHPGQTLATPAPKTAPAGTLISYAYRGSTWHPIQQAKLSQG